MNTHESPHLYAFGVSHQTAGIQVRERLSFNSEEATRALADLVQQTGVREACILSTCNRSEFYLLSTQAYDGRQWLSHYRNLSSEAVHSLFLHENRDAIRHIFRVACGLDSRILGEPQILGQMKDAYHLAKSCGAVASVLDRLFQQTFAVAKQVRNTTAIGRNPISVAYAGVRLTRQFFDDHEQRTALVIGAGDTGSLTARYLRDAGIGRLIIANRTLAHAQTLAREVGGYAIELEELNAHLHEADLIFGTAHTPVVLITRDQVAQAMKKRRDHLQVYVDLGVPRNFAADLDAVGQAFCYGVDDLEQIIDENVHARQKAAHEAEVMVNLYSDDFLGWLHAKPQQQLIRRIRENAEATRAQLLKDAYRRLAHGDDPALILEQMSHRLTNKLMHNPSELINAIPPDHKDWLAIVADTFNVDSQEND